MTNSNVEKNLLTLNCLPGNGKKNMDLASREQRACKLQDMAHG